MQIKNRYLSLLFDTFDTPIRFLYSRAGVISTTLNKLMFWKLYSSDFIRLNDNFLHVRKLLKEQQIDIRGKIVLELGPGNSYINAYNFLMNGAKKVILIDKYSRYIQTKKQLKFMQQEIAFLKNQYAGQDIFFLDKDGAIKDGFIELNDKDITDLQKKILPVDFIYSTSVLEHLRNADKAIQSMNLLLKPGGFMYHHIDMRDHYNFSSPFLFYKYSNRIWENWLTKEGMSYTNRWRYWDFINSFKASGFSLVREETTRYHLNGKSLHEEFRGQKDIDIGLMDIILQKDAHIT